MKCEHRFHLIESKLLWSGGMFERKKWTRVSLFVCENCGETKEVKKNE